jgi:hypothetical protein
MDDRDFIERLRRRSAASVSPEPAYQRLLDRRDRKARNSRLASGVMALVVFAVAIAAAAFAFVGHGTRTGQGSPFSSGGSTTQGGGTNLVAGPGHDYYLKTEHVETGPNVIEEMWWAQDGSGRYFVDQTNPDYGVMSDRTWTPGDFPGTFPFETDLSGLSTNPDQLRQQLIDRSAPNGASPEPEATVAPTTSVGSTALLRSGTDILQMGNATPDLRVAVYDVLSQLPEATIGHADDPVGRPAVTLTFQIGEAYGGGTQTLYFDPGTHLVLAMNGPLSGQFVVMDEGIVDSTQATPTAGQQFFPPASP